jgi:DNA-binding NtrC family response regulator
MKNIKVMFVDDEEEFVRLLAERARMRELGSEIALDGSEALAKLGKNPPDVMILDFSLPDIDGLTILEQVKKNYPDVQVVMLTAHGNPETERKVRDLGAFDYLEKPVGIDKLTKTIEKAYRYKQKLGKRGES